MISIKGLRSGLLTALITSFATGVAAHAADVTVSAAASLTNAFKELGPGFETQHPGTKVRFNFAASDALLAQISNGAPVDVFAPADQETMDKAESRKLLAPGTRRNFASNELVLITPAEGGQILTALNDLGRPEIKRVALGKPEGVPAGRYAKHALEAAKLWAVIEPKAIYTTSVRQALDYVARAEVEVGFVYATDAALQNGKVRRLFSVPTDTAITYPIALTLAGTNAADAQKFIDYVMSPVGQAVLAKYGFRKP